MSVPLPPPRAEGNAPAESVARGAVTPAARWELCRPFQQQGAPGGGRACLGCTNEKGLLGESAACESLKRGHQGAAGVWPVQQPGQCWSKSVPACRHEGARCAGRARGPTPGVRAQRGKSAQGVLIGWMALVGPAQARTLEGGASRGVILNTRHRRGGGPHGSPEVAAAEAAGPSSCV